MLASNSVFSAIQDIRDKRAEEIKKEYSATENIANALGTLVDTMVMYSIVFNHPNVTSTEEERGHFFRGHLSSMAMLLAPDDMPDQDEFEKYVVHGQSEKCRFSPTYRNALVRAETLMSDINADLADLALVNAKGMSR